MSDIDGNAAGCFETCVTCAVMPPPTNTAPAGATSFNVSRADGEQCIGTGPASRRRTSAQAAARQNGYEHTTVKSISIGTSHRV